MASVSKPKAPTSLLLFALITLLFLSLSNGTLAKSHSKTAHAHAPVPAPAPTQDCSAYLADIADCIDFVELGSNSTKPTASCCLGLKKVVRENERCLCDALDNSKDYGIKLNMSRAVSMPSACGITTPSASNCKISAAPASAPVPASSSSTGAAAIPSPPPGTSLAMTLSISTLTLSLGIAMVVYFVIVE